MKKEYDLKKLKKRPGKPKPILNANKIATSIRIDGTVIAELKTQGLRLGIPYQTLIGSILHRYVKGELVDVKSIDLTQLLKHVS